MGYSGVFFALSIGAYSATGRLLVVERLSENEDEGWVLLVQEGIWVKTRWGGLRYKGAVVAAGEITPRKAG